MHQVEQPTNIDSPIQNSIVQARAGSDSALGQLLAHYRDYLLGIANEECSSNLAAKIAPSDIVQETCLQATEDFPKFRGTTEAELKVWLRQVLIHNVLDAQRRYQGTEKRNTSRECCLHDGGPSLADGLVSELPSPSQLAIHSEQYEAVRTALHSLSPEYQQVIQLRNFEYRSFPQIALEMGRSVGAVQQLWSRAVDSLAEQLVNDDSGVRSGD